MGSTGIAIDTAALKKALLVEVSNGEYRPLQVVESLTNQGFPTDEVRSVLMDLLNSGELLLTSERLLQPSM